MSKTKVFFAALGGALVTAIVMSGRSPNTRRLPLETGHSRLGRYRIEREIINGPEGVRVIYRSMISPRWKKTEREAESYGEVRKLLEEQAGELHVRWLRWPDLLDQA